MMVFGVVAISSLVLGLTAITHTLLEYVYDYFDGKFWPFMAIGTPWIFLCGALTVAAAEKMFG